MKIRFTLISALWLVSCGGLLTSARAEPRPRTEPAVQVFEAPDRAREAGEHLRIATYNLENYSDGIGDGPRRTPERLAGQTKGAARIIDRMAPDILMLQEIENPSVLRMLAGACDTPFANGYITSLESPYGEVKLNLALLSRLEPLEVMEIDFGPLTSRNRPPRGALRARFALGDRRQLLIYGVHLKSNWGDRERNIEKRRAGLYWVVRDLEAVRDRHPGIRWEVLVAGDMNVDPQSPDFRDDRSLDALTGMEDLWAGVPPSARVTLPTRRGDPERLFPPVVFDRLFANRGLVMPPWRAREPSVIRAGVNTSNIHAVPGEDGHISDHYPVYIDLVP